MTDEEYIEFVKENENKSILEIEPKNKIKQMIKASLEIPTTDNTTNNYSEYNEIFISNPKSPMAVFAYEVDKDVDNIGNPIEFLNRTEQTEYEKNHYEKSVKERTEFLRQYALEHNIPFIVFGD